MTKKRSVDANFVTREREVNKKRMSKLRSEENNKILGEDSYNSKESRANRYRMRTIRKNEIYNQTEKISNKKRIRNLRDEETYANLEKNKNRSSKRALRASDIMNFRLFVSNQLKRQNLEVRSSQQLKFIESRRQTPSYVCLCCEGMFFEAGVRKITRENIISKMSQRLSKRNLTSTVDSRVMNKYDKQKQNYVCHTCNKYIGEGKIPKLSSSNGLKLPPVPDCINMLNDVEERLLSPYVPFMKIILLSHRASNPQVGMSCLLFLM